MWKFYANKHYVAFLFTISWQQQSSLLKSPTLLFRALSTPFTILSILIVIVRHVFWRLWNTIMFTGVSVVFLFFWSQKPVFVFSVRSSWRTPASGRWMKWMQFCVTFWRRKSRQSWFEAVPRCQQVAGCQTHYRTFIFTFNSKHDQMEWLYCLFSHHQDNIIGWPVYDLHTTTF